jgi:predicted protein tyrosine phosphatase
VVPKLLLAGEFPGAADPNEARRKLTRLADAGIRHVINLMEPDETDHSGNLFAPYKAVFEAVGKERGLQVSCVRFPVPDLGVPPPRTMRAILDSIDGAIQRRRPVYIHCWGGVGRTGTAVGCFLLRRGIADSGNVFETIARLRKDDPAARRRSPETTAQEKMVLSWLTYEKATTPE